VAKALYPLINTRNQALACLRYATLLMFALTLSLGYSCHNLATANDTTTELLMIESDDCPYCRKFDREVADIYPKTTEGLRAPLNRHKLGDKLPKKYTSIDINSRTMTPTFILIENNKEVDRLVGYNGDEFFWFLLKDLFTKLATR